MTHLAMLPNDDLNQMLLRLSPDKADHLIILQNRQRTRLIRTYRLRLMELKNALEDETNSDMRFHLQYETEELESRIKDMTRQIASNQHLKA